MELRPEMLFAEGKSRALTLSYDDGTIYDRKLVSLMNTYGIKGTFNLNSGLFSQKELKEMDGVEVDFSRIEEEEVETLYEGHEVASHTENHPSLTAIPQNMGAAEVLKDRQKLKELTGDEITGFAYPYGTYNEKVEELLMECGIHYARTVVSTEEFDIPVDFLEWHPTCHHNSVRLMELAGKFCEEESWKARLFYLWGHSYEFERDDNWQIIEEFFAYMQEHKEDIWFATNREIVDYVQAYRQLQWSSDGKILYNPTGKDLWYGIGNKVFCIHGEERQTIG